MKPCPQFFGFQKSLYMSTGRNRNAAVLEREMRPWKVVLGSAEFREAARALLKNTRSLKETAWEKLLQEVTNGKAGNINGAGGTV